MRRLYGLSFITGALLLTGTLVQAQPYSYYGVIEQRNIFHPLWNIKVDNRSELEKARKEEERRQAELKTEAERQALEAKKNELSQAYSLTGVVFNGKNYYALINDRRTGRGGDYALGDTLDGAKITDISEENQSVALDYEGKFTLTLRISNK